MSDSIKIQVYSESQATGSTATKSAVTDAEVTLLTREAAKKEEWPYLSLKPSHDHDKEGFYKPKDTSALAPGEYLLVVKQGKLSPVVQRLTIAAKSGVLEVEAGWDKKLGAKHRAATVSIVNVGPRATPIADKPQFATVNVVMMPRTEWVGLASHNHFSRRPAGQGRDGTRYLPFALGRRNQLYKAGILDKATVCTILDCQGRRTLVTVKSAAPGHREWVTIHEKEKAAIDPAKDRPKLSSNEEIGIEDFYDTIDSIGWIHPGTLIEAGVFGHGWVQGPIVWGTSDFSNSIKRWPGDGTTPKDLDGRQKDFFKSGGRTYNGTEAAMPFMSKFPELGAAFRKDGKLYLWGCVHMNNVLAQCSAAWGRIQDKTPRNEFFKVSYEGGGREFATLDDIKRNVFQAVVSDLFGRPLEHGDARGSITYAGAAAQFLGKSATVFAAATGMGSNYGMRGGDNIFLINTTGENARPFRWWRAEFGSDFETDADSFVNYSKLKGASVADPGWRTERHALIHDDDSEFEFPNGTFGGNLFALRLPSGFELFLHGSFKKSTTFPMPEAHKMGSDSGHLYIIRGAQMGGIVQRPLGRCALLSSSDSDDMAVFVDTSGKTRLLTAPKGSKAAAFKLHTGTVKIRGSVYKWQNSWQVPDAEIGTITNGVLEEVSPRWYW